MTDDDIRDELDAFLAGDDMPVPSFVDDTEPLWIEDEQQVQRMLRKRARLVHERERVERIAGAEVDRIAEFVSDRVHGIGRALLWLDRGLEQWTRRMNERDRKRKSWAMPSGTLKLRAPGTHATSIVDAAAFMDWIAEDVTARGALVKQPPVVPDVAAIKSTLKLGPVVDTIDGRAYHAAVDDDGAVVPGVQFTKPAEDAFDIAHPKDDAGVTAPVHDDDQPQQAKDV